MDSQVPPLDEIELRIADYFNYYLIESDSERETPTASPIPETQSIWDFDDRRCRYCRKVTPTPYWKRINERGTLVLCHRCGINMVKFITYDVFHICKNKEIQRAVTE
ncbi:hypothetical protein ACTA71_009378 [Dictyostelium dimigraforme]